ncbi:hypothetical protein Fmac_011374 [Flemingia macrophylla]|uniref:Uncharacterized protein n=1 Tax=Flemingia macrophylla TaxID=520843 RepID=A0ABD1MM94_9FABA
MDGRVVDVICIDDEEGPSGKIESGNGGSSSLGAFVKEGFEYLGASDDGSEEVISVGDSDDGISAEEGLRHCNMKRREVKEEQGCEEGKGWFKFREERVKGPSLFVGKVESFEDDEYGGRPDKPVLMSQNSCGDSESEEEFGGDESDSEDGETSDEDFRVDEDGVEIEWSSSEESDTSSYDDDDEKMVKRRERNVGSATEDDDMKTKSRTKKMQNHLSEKMVKGRVRKMESATESSGVWRKRKMERENNEEEEWVGPDCASATSCKSTFSKEETPKEAHNTSHQSGSLQKEPGDSAMAQKSEKNDNVHAKTSVSVDIEEHDSEPEKEIDILWKEMDRMLRDGDTEIGDSTVVQRRKKNNNLSSFRKRQDKIGRSTEYVIKEGKKERANKKWFNINNREKVRVLDDDEEIGDKFHEDLKMPSRTKDQCFKLFAECFWGKHDSIKHDSNEFKEKDHDVGCGQTTPLVYSGGIPLDWVLTKEEPIKKTESEKQLDTLWEEMDMLLRAEEIGSQVGNIETDEARENPASHCNHDNTFNEEIGIYCRWCGWVATEIKYMTPPFVDSERSGRRGLHSGVNTQQFDRDLFNDTGNDSEAVWSQGTVWDLIPDIKQSLYPHQQEGLEFIWKNLAGSIDLPKIKRVDPRSEGGCIISHAPGTGKTRLAMVFLQTYLQVFPKCLPVIIAPANILLTWEDELRKWNIGIPFHNLNNADLSGKEHAISEIDWSCNRQHNKDAVRMMKLYSWYKEKSILLISYTLYKNLAGENYNKNRKLKKEKKRARTREHIKTALGEVLRDYPGLLILDEGHTPRNRRSNIWKVLSKSRTQKRILLSGTPFQNNFRELYNILCLMKPSFPDSIPQELKKFCQSRLMHDRQAPKDASWEPISSGNPADGKINQLKSLMTPFVNVHKGSILQKNLPGLRDCVLVLKPDNFQQQILDSIECSQSGLNFEHKLSLVSVHPSLFLNCSLSVKEESLIDKDHLEKLRLEPYGGVKTKFLIEFVKLCDAVKEKVLIFSQFIDTLCLIKDHLESTFNWSVGTEVLYMYGRIGQKQKQSLIHRFNDANSQAKVFLASTKACFEGINLTGASRVVLVDVVWNPSVERQAICRAYRLGQKRAVYTYHLLAQDTPEFTKYCKQAEKDRLSELVFSNKNAESDKIKSCGIKFEDEILNIMIEHKNLKEIFAECLLQPKDRDLKTAP